MIFNRIDKTAATELYFRKACVLFSYNTPVAAFANEKYYRTNKFYSKTTSRHINNWLEGIKAIEVDPDFFEKLVSEC